MTNEDGKIDGLWATVDASRLDQDVHVIPLDSLFQRFHTDQGTGLSTTFVPDAQAQYGSNRITPPQPPGYFWLVCKQLFIGFNSILWLAGVLAFITYQPLGAPTPSITNLALGVVLFLVIIDNATLNVYHEIKSIKIVASFSKLLPIIATVRRDGIEQQIAADEIVPGDIILIRMGDKLPADCRFLVCNELKVNTLFLLFLGNSFVFIVVLKTYSD
jgi:sodium/potassium-transporting ATPase subunit alpha